MKKVILFLCITFLCLTAACGSKFEINQSYPADNVEGIHVQSDSWDVRFKESESNEVTVSVEGKTTGDSNPVTIQDNESILYIKQEEQIEGGFMEGFTFGKNGAMMISIPESAVNEMELINKSGNIEMTGISIPNIQLQNSSGEGKIEKVTADTGDFETDAGMLSFMDSSFQNLNITSGDGEIILKEIKDGNKLSVDTDAGDISISYKDTPTSLKVTAESNSSDVTLSLENLQKEEDTEKMQKGTIGEGENSLELTSNQGVIHITD